jgi:hypothetical protein
VLFEVERECGLKSVMTEVERERVNGCFATKIVLGERRKKQKQHGEVGALCMNGEIGPT